MENVYKTLSVSVNICKNNGINVNMSMRFDCMYYVYILKLSGKMYVTFTILLFPNIIVQFAYDSSLLYVLDLLNIRLNHFFSQSRLEHKCVIPNEDYIYKEPTV